MRQKYTDEKFHVEDYYGDSFEILYDEKDPGRFVIGEEATFPFLLCFVSLGLLVLTTAGIVKIVKY